MLVVICFLLYLFFFFKQKTAYEMRISDWSSDVCSSDLLAPFGRRRAVVDLSISAVEDGVGGAGKMPGPAGLGSALRGAGVGGDEQIGDAVTVVGQGLAAQALDDDKVACLATQPPEVRGKGDRKSTRLNSRH